MVTLTTREYIATHLLSGLMMSEPYDKVHLVGIAIEATDELLRQLEETKKKPPVSIVHHITNSKDSALVRDVLRVLEDPSTNIDRYGVLGEISNAASGTLFAYGYTSTYNKADNMTRFTKN